jgi:hypothetical protein
MKTLFAKLLILSSLVVALLLAVDLVYRRTYNAVYEVPENILISPKIAEPYQLVKVGNSHAQSGIDLTHYNEKSLDLSGVAQRFVFDLALLKQYHQQIDDNAVILIAVTPISFSHRKADRNDGLQGNYYGRLSPFLIPDLKVSDYLQRKVVPFVRAGYLFRRKHTEAVTSRIADEQSRPEPEQKSPEPEQESPEPKQKASEKTTSVQPNNALPSKVTRVLNVNTADYYYNVEAIQHELANTTAVETRLYMDNMNFIYHKWYETDEFDPKYFEGNREDLEKLIEYCLEHNWRPVLITIPITHVLQDGLLDDYMQKYLYDNLEKTDLQGVEYIDFSKDERITKNNFLFENADHLNSRGSAIFSYLLLQELIHRGYFSEETDGYDYRPLYVEKERTS